MGPYILKNLSHDFNISRPYMERMGINENHEHKCLMFRGTSIPLGTSQQAAVKTPSRVYVMEDKEIPANEISTITVEAPGLLGSTTSRGTISPDQAFYLKTGCLPVAKPIEITTNEKKTFQVPVYNVQPQPLKIRKGVRYGTLHDISISSINNIFNL